MAADFHWDLLRSFLAVVREGSLGKAAEALGTSQPSLGRHVKQLEQQLGVELFERRARRLVATPFALQLVTAAGGMESGAAEVARLLQARSAKATRTVRISASRMVATHLLPPLLAAFTQAERPFSIELSADDRLSNLAEREADLAVRLVKPTQHSLIARRVGIIRLGLYAARSYLKKRPAPARMSDLAAHTVVGFDRSQLMMRGARRLGIALERGDYGFRSDDRVVHWAAVRAGVGLGVLPTYLAAREPNLVRVLAEHRFAPSGVWLVAQRDVLDSPHVRELFDGLRVSLGQALSAAPD